MTRVIRRHLATCGLTALLTTACSAFAVANSPPVDGRETQRVSRLPDVLLPLRALYPDMAIPAPSSATARPMLSTGVARGGVNVLTLWDSRRSNFSLLAASQGTVSLQWTSKWFGGDAAPGLINRLLELAAHDR